jgi:hypothetical protein
MKQIKQTSSDIRDVYMQDDAKIFDKKQDSNAQKG